MTIACFYYPVSSQGTTFIPRGKLIRINVAINKKDHIFGNIRKVAIRFLEGFDEKNIQLILLQLVSALKYESFDVNSSELKDFLFKTCANSKYFSNQLYWLLSVEIDNSIFEVSEWYK